MSEKDYARGRHAALLMVVRHALRETYGLGMADDPLVALGTKLAELEETRATVRSLCEEHGVKFDEELHLSDQIEKRLVRTLVRR